MNFWNRITLIFFSLLLFLGEFSQVEAGELRPLYRGAREQAMGGAFIAISDDESAIWTNPSGLAEIEKGVVHYATLDIESSDDIIGVFKDASNAFSTFSADSLNLLMGHNIYGRASYSAALAIPNFGIGILSDAQVAFYSRNKSLPRLTFGYQTTNGIQAGFGFTVNKVHRRRKGGELRVGFGAKLLWRRGGYYLLPLSTLLRISEGNALLTDIVGSFEAGFGGDLGAQYIHHFSDKLNLRFGASYMNIGDIKFGDGGPATVDGNLGIGLGMKYLFNGFKLTVAYDYEYINQPADWRARSHFGFELELPFLLSLYGGVNQTSITYGTSFNFWIFRLTALSYGQQIATFVGQDVNRRYMLRLDMKFDM